MKKTTVSLLTPCGTAFVATGSQSTTQYHAERFSVSNWDAHLLQALAMCMHKTGLLVSKPLALSCEDLLEPFWPDVGLF